MERTADFEIGDSVSRSVDRFASIAPDLPAWVDGDPATAACAEPALRVELAEPTRVVGLTLYPGDVTTGVVTSPIARFVVRTDGESIVVTVPEIPPGDPALAWGYPEVALSGAPIRWIQVAVERRDPASPPCWSGIRIGVP